MYISGNSKLDDHKLKQRNLEFNATVVFHATPASKVHGGDLEGSIAYLRTEGIIADADAIEAVTWTTANDENSGDSVFGILLDGSILDENGRGIEKVLSCEIFDRSGSATSLAIRGPNSGAVSTMLTSGGNIAIEIAGTGLRLDQESANLSIRISYKLK